MEHAVHLHRNVQKNIDALPDKIQEKLFHLVRVLRESGPRGPRAWTNYGRLEGQGERYHCHLTGDHNWVASWAYEKNILTIEIYYAGSHQKAPY